MPKDSRLRKPSEFRHVYEKGRRFDGGLMTLFLLPSAASSHRIGITASKKGIGKAYQRNRAKRLLRETFRLSCAELGELKGKYDWVLNARRGLLRVKLDKSLQGFRQLIEAVKVSELKSAKGAENIVVETQNQ